MKKRKWQKWYDRCVICGRNDVPYWANGMCRKCYYKMRYKTVPGLKEYYKKKTNEWRKKNPERWNQIVTKAQKKFYNK